MPLFEVLNNFSPRILKGKVINQKFSGFLMISDFKESHRTRLITLECLTRPVVDTSAEISAKSSTTTLGKSRLQNSGSQTSACIRSPPEGLLKPRGWALHSEFLIQQVWDRVREFAFLKCFQVMVMLPVWKSFSENHWQRILYTRSPFSPSEARKVKVSSNGLKETKGHWLSSITLIYP